MVFIKLSSLSAWGCLLLFDALILIVFNSSLVNKKIIFPLAEVS